MLIRKSLGILFATALAISIVGCGSDKDTDDYKNSRVAEEIAKTEAVAGTYRGAITRIDGTSLGELRIDLESDIKVNSSVSGPVPDRQASLKGMITRYQDYQTYLSFSQAFYSTGSGDLQANIDITRKNGGKVTLQLTGQIKGNQLAGTLEALGFPDYKATFTLTKNAPVGPNEATKTTRSDSIPPLNYISTGSDLGSATLLVQTNFVNEDDEFLDSFVFVKIVDATINFDGRRVPTPFLNASLDMVKNKLYSQSSQNLANTGDKRNTTLNCTATKWADGTPGWDCTYEANQINPTRILFKKVK